MTTFINVFGTSESISKLHLARASISYSNFCTIYISFVYLLKLQFDQLSIAALKVFLTSFFFYTYSLNHKLPNASTRERLISSPPFNYFQISSVYRDGLQLRSKKEVEALLQGTLGNNNAYLEKKI